MPPKKSGKSKGKKKSKPVSAKNQIAGDSSLSSEQVAELKKTFGAFSKGSKLNGNTLCSTFMGVQARNFSRKRLTQKVHPAPSGPIFWSGLEAPDSLVFGATCGGHAHFTAKNRIFSKNRQNHDFSLPINR